jgi:hypothetical protein
MDHSTITKAIIKSQHCQRNWDLSRSIPEDDINLLVTAATNCPSKQNIAFYKLHFITDRTIIESVHEHTKGFVVKLSPTHNEYTTNSQTLANLLIVFEKYTNLEGKYDQNRNDQTRNISKGISDPTHDKDRLLAVGVAAGYINLTANLLGYSTGCCSCMNELAIRETVGADNDILLLMGVGYKNPSRNRRIHQVEDYMFPTKPKQNIPISFK